MPSSKNPLAGPLEVLREMAEDMRSNPPAADAPSETPGSTAVQADPLPETPAGAGAAAPAPGAGDRAGLAAPVVPEASSSPPWSLRRHINRSLITMVSALWVAASLVSIAGVWLTTANLFDSALNETAERFLYLPDVVVQDTLDEQRFLKEIGPHVEHVVYQVYDGAGSMRLRSHDAPAEPLDAGAITGVHNTPEWRVLTMTRVDGQRRVQVAISMRHRYEIIWGSLGWLLGMLFLVLPLATLTITVIIRQGFRGLEPIRKALTERPHEDMQPVRSDNAPEEMLPWLSAVNSLIARDRVLIEAERAFAARTAHELRTPLAAARAQAQRVAELTPVDSRAHQSADALVRQLDRLTRLATRLLQLARFESLANVRLEPVNLEFLGRMVVSEFSGLVSGERLRVYVNTDETGVIGDIDAIGIALRNLIDNALKHGANDGNQSWVRVLIEPMSIMVINDGPGVPPEILAKLVRPFERGITAAEGSGLGLSITSAILAKGGGTLELKSPVLGSHGFAAILRFE